jgi:hypothetical protein
MKIEGLPLSSAMDHPEVQAWIEAMPTLKECFVTGKILGILLVQPPRIAVHASIDLSVLKELSSIAIIEFDP